MNPLEMLRALAESVAEGERISRYGVGYKGKLRGQELENQGRELDVERAGLEVADLPGHLKRRAAAEELPLSAEAERQALRLARARVNGVTNDSPEAIAAFEAAQAEEARKLDMAKTNAQIDSERAQTEKAKQTLPNARPDLSPEAINYLGVSPDSPQGPMPPPTNADIDILQRRRDEEARVRAAAAGRHSSMGAALPADTIQDVADRYVSGELTFDQARGALGGVKGMQTNGPALMSAIADRRGFSPQIRKDLGGIQTTRNIVDQMEGLMNDIINAPNLAERVKATALLEQFGQTTGTLLSRGFGERGVVTDKDVARATGLVPGWKAANFAPEYAARELALLREVLDRNERGVIGANVTVRDRQGNVVSGPGAAAGTGPGSDAASLKKKYGVDY